MDYSISEGVKARVGLGMIFGMGIGLSVLHVTHALGEARELESFVTGIMVPLGLTLGLIAAGLWLWHRNPPGDGFLRMGVWCLLGAIALSFGGALVILHQQAEGTTIADAGFLIAGQASVGSAGGFLVGFYDLRRRTAITHAEQLSEQLSVLNRVLRHDIRNEANVIQGRSESIEDTEIADDVAIIQDKADNLVALGEHARLIERLLHSEFEQDQMDFSHVLETELAKLERNGTSVTIETSSPDDMRVRAHPMIDAAVRNILDNAVRHNDSDDPRIEVCCHPETAEGRRYLVVRIADNGPGIPEREIEVLERGYETPLEHTSGLGLWLINWLISESDGEIWFEANEPRGSVVCLRLRRART